MSANEATQQANRAGMDSKRLVVISYLVFGLVLAMFVGHMLDLVFARFNLPNGRVIEGLDVNLTALLGFALTLGGGIYCWVNPRIHGLSMEVAEELMRVTWPTWEETRISTVAVIVASLIASIVLFGIDSLSYKLIVDWLPILWGKL